MHLEGFRYYKISEFHIIHVTTTVTSLVRSKLCQIKTRHFTSAYCLVVNLYCVCFFEEKRNVSFFYVDILYMNFLFFFFKDTMFEITTAPGIRLRGSKDKYGEGNI